MTGRSPADDDGATPLDGPRLTWAVLLGRWVEFARSALALPDDAFGRRMRAAVPDIIMLQAVWFALQHVDELDAAQRALGLDRAEILIDTHVSALRRRFEDDVPAQIQELIGDAQRQLAAAVARDTAARVNPDDCPETDAKREADRSDG